MKYVIWMSTAKSTQRLSDTDTRQIKTIKDMARVVALEKGHSTRPTQHIFRTDQNTGLCITLSMPFPKGSEKLEHIEIEFANGGSKRERVFSISMRGGEITSFKGEISASDPEPEWVQKIRDKYDSILLERLRSND
jgi:hypothetical protein